SIGEGATASSKINTGNKICQFKLVFLGEPAVGKSSLVLHFVKGQLHDFQESTTKAVFLSCMKCGTWDTIGQE
uniref:Uncharacterized protein n=2 Tax=Bos TaxID=9903 RepID=A0A4W2ILH9_BOBOX